MGVSNLLSAEKLREMPARNDLVIIDARHDLSDPAAGRAAYEAGHIPTAVHLDLGRDLSAPAGEHGGRHPLPDPAQMSDLFGSVGIGPDKRVVVYDTETGMFASRVWWMLRYLGFDAVQVLDGGLTAWTRAGGQLSTEPAAAMPTVFVPSVRAEMLASRDEVMAAVGNEAVRIVDARGRERWSGESEPLDRVAGRIPGALNIPAAENVRDGRLLGQQELRQLYRDVSEAPEAILYCGSGVSATVDVLAMVEAGLPMPRLYAGSWSDWSSYADAPVEKD